MDLGLAGRRAIVTGGSKGIGFAVAAELVAEGASVAICSRNGTELTAAATAIGGAVYPHPADVTDVDSVEAFVAAAAERLGAVIDVAGGMGKYV